MPGTSGPLRSGAVSVGRGRHSAVTPSSPAHSPHRATVLTGETADDGRVQPGNEETERSAALVVRVWLEGGPDGFRARLTTGDLQAGLEAGEAVTVAVAATPEAVVDAVRAWLDDFVAARAGS